MTRTMFLLLGFLLWLASDQARGDSFLPRSLQKVGFDQRLDAQTPLDLEFVDELGHAIKLGDCFGDKPSILILSQYRCPMLCTQVLNGLVRGLLDIPFDIGKEFNVVTVSFDPREPPELAAAKKKTYIERYGRPGAEDGWHFLTGQEDAIKQLTAAVGFRYTYDPKADQFAHASGLLIVTPGGRISRYLYGIDFSPRDLRYGLEEASRNQIGSVLDHAVLFFCFHYDPEEGKYGPVVMNFVRLGGILTVVALGTFIAVMWRKERRGARRDLVKAV